MPLDASLSGAFGRAIAAFAQRSDVVTRERFDRLTREARARAFTVARVQDLDVLNDIHAELAQSLLEGGSYREFIDGLEDVMERRGWTGLEPHHSRLVYEQNVNQAYTAGRWEQAKESGINYYRKLPSDAENPRPDHAKHDNKVFPMDGPTPPPPWDFGCQCGWEVVFDDELPGGRKGVSTAKPTEGARYDFHPRDYASQPGVDLSSYPEEWREQAAQILEEQGIPFTS